MRELRIKVTTTPRVHDGIYHHDAVNVYLFNEGNTLLDMMTFENETEEAVLDDLQHMIMTKSWIGALETRPNHPMNKEP